MEIKRINRVVFSPTGNAKKISDKLISEFNAPVFDYDLMRQPLTMPLEFSPDELLIVSIPVFEGRVPKFILEAIGNLYGNNTPAIALVSFGCRAYDDALIELCDILSANGICPIAAGAFASEHSVLHRLGRRRPDESDMAEIAAFAAQCVKKISEAAEAAFEPVAVPGERPYRTIPGNFSLVPTGDEACTKCLDCVNVCPAGAIDPENSAETDAGLCATCYACALICPVRCRMPRDPVLPEVLGFLMELVDKRAENETFIS